MTYRYLIMNYTDGITATPDLYSSKKKAQEVIDQKRQQYKDIQGYYRTNRWEKIDPDDINYQIVKV